MYYIVYRFTKTYAVTKEAIDQMGIISKNFYKLFIKEATKLCI